MKNKFTDYLLIKPMRLKKGIKQIDLAKKLCIQTSTLSNIEAGRIAPSVALLQKICKELGSDFTSSKPPKIPAGTKQLEEFQGVLYLDAKSQKAVKDLIELLVKGIK